MESSCRRGDSVSASEDASVRATSGQPEKPYEVSPVRTPLAVGSDQRAKIAYPHLGQRPVLT